MIRKIVGICIALAFSLGAQAHELTVAERNEAQGFNDTIDRLAPDFVTVSLCIADPTDQSQDYLGITGHAFLRLQCPTFGLDYCVSYESERIKGQLWDYLTGRLKMGMRAVPTDEYIEDYRIWQRAVREYHICMPPESKLKLWEQMDRHVEKEQELEMDLIRYGCANSLLRCVERALTPVCISYNWPTKYLTQNAIEIARVRLENYPWSFLGMRITMGRSLAKLRTPKEKVIFPLDLLEVWQSASINGQPMLTYVGDLVEAEPVIVKKSWFTPRLCGILLLILIAGCIAFLLVRKHKKMTDCK